MATVYTDENQYANLVDIKAALNIPDADTGEDNFILSRAGAASRYIEGPWGAETFFYQVSEKRFFDPIFHDILLLPYDLLSITTLKTDEGNDGTFETTWTDLTDFYATAGDSDYHSFPLLQIRKNANSEKFFPKNLRSTELDGVWGHGDGKTAASRIDSGWDITFADATTEAFSVNDETGRGLRVGDTFLIESEQCFVLTITSGPAAGTARRGVNSTTPDAHDNKEATRYLYPADVIQVCIDLTVALFNNRDEFGGVLQGSAPVGSPPRLILDVMEPLRRYNGRHTRSLEAVQ